MTLEEVIRKNAYKFSGLSGSEYIIRIQNDVDGVIYFYVRPSDRDGDTVNFVLKDNEVMLEKDYISQI